MFIKTLLLFFIVSCLELPYANQLHAQTSPPVQWQKSLGGTLIESADDIYSTPDGGYIVGGTTQSSDGDISGFHGTFDYWVVKLDASRNIQWQKCYGGSGDETLASIKLTPDGGYILAGTSNSVDGDVTGHHGTTIFPDVWVVKINSAGAIEWEKSLGGSRFERNPTLITTSDGGYILTGETDSNDGDVSGLHSLNSDVWVVKLTSSGTIQWQKCYGGTDYEKGNDIKETIDGGYIFTGHTYSNDMDVSGNHGSYPSFDVWVVKITSNGNIQWQKCYGGTGQEYPTRILQTSDGGYIVTGNTRSNDGDVSGNHGDADIWVFKLNASGIIQWQKCFGGTAIDYGFSISQTTDGGYVLAGLTSSTDGDITSSNGGVDVWVIKLNIAGGIEWQKCYGGSNAESASSIKPTPDGGYLIAGYSSSNNGDISGNHGGADFWIAKLGPIPCTPNITISTINTTVCKGDNVSFSAAVTNGGINPVYQWFINANPAGTNSNQFSTALLANGDTIKCIMISNAGCASQPQVSSNYIVMNVLDSALPTVQINTSTNTICAGTAVSFTATITNGGSTPVYQWLVNSTPVGNSLSTFTTSSLTNNDIVSCLLTSNAPCISLNTILSNQLQITVNPSPLGSISPAASTTVCAGDVVMLTANGGTSYQWQLNGNNISGASSSTYIAKQSGNYSAMISDGVCSSKSINNSVVSILKYEAGIRYNTIRVAANLPYNLQAREIGSSYAWSPSLGLNNPSVSNPILTTSSDATYFISISSSLFCPVTDTLKVQVFASPGVYIPTAFTPNRDGLNDKLTPIPVHIKEIKSFKVFNRYGELVFSTNKIGEGWNGIYKGSLQPQGVYVWLFEGVDSKGSSIKEKGNSLLLR